MNNHEQSYLHMLQQSIKVSRKARARNKRIINKVCVCVEGDQLQDYMAWAREAELIKKVWETQDRFDFNQCLSQKEKSYKSRNIATPRPSTYVSSKSRRLRAHTSPPLPH